jgi:hypothetical protein
MSRPPQALRTMAVAVLLATGTTACGDFTEPNVLPVSEETTQPDVASLRSATLVTEVMAASGREYRAVEPLDESERTYTDRAYVYEAVPSSLEGATFIQTANDDKSATDDQDFLTFDLSRDATVYVAHDDRLERPSWLTDGFSDTGMDLGMSDGPSGAFSLYAAGYSAGPVVLGGNVVNQTNNSSMYTVIVAGADDPGDGVPPVVSITAPADGSTVSGVIVLEAAASDQETSVVSVEFTVGNNAVGSDTSTPYSVQWDSQGASDGEYQITATARDEGGNTASASISVVVDNHGDGGLTISNVEADSGEPYSISDGLDNGDRFYIDRSYTYRLVPPSLEGLSYIRTANDDKNAEPGSSSFLTFDISADAIVYVAHDDRLARPEWLLSGFADTGLDVDASDAPSQSYSIFMSPFPAGTVTLGANARTAETASSMYGVIVEPAHDGSDTEPPTQPTNLSASALSSSRIDLAWDASTDNVGVEGYRVYRDEAQIASVTETSYSDTGLAPSNSYSYQVQAFDAAGNTSALSSPASATTDGSTSAIRIPARDEWTERGAVILPGPAGAWDHRLSGMISPADVIKKDGTYYLYYLGATGDRYDGGPANRTLGVATSADGITFDKYAGNPVITHQPSREDGTENAVEEGVFSAGALVDADGTFVLYFGGMEATSSRTVDSDAVLATSSNGLDFTVAGDVIRNGDPDFSDGSDEVFPVGAYRAPSGDIKVYYVSSAGNRDLSVATGPDRDDLRSGVVALDLSDPVTGGGDPSVLNDSTMIVPIQVTYEGEIQFRRTTPGAPEDLSTLVDTQFFDDLGGGSSAEISGATILLDPEAGFWFLYYLSSDGLEIRLRTAPIRYE